MSREAWLDGPIGGVPPLVMPVAHALVQSRADLRAAAHGLSPAQLWLRPGGAASIGFHLRHIPGTIDRLLTYARGAALDDAQFAALRREGEAGSEGIEDLLERVDSTITGAVAILRATSEQDLLSPREVGRARLPSTVIGLLFHAAEHTQRHTGQVITTAKIIRGLDLQEGDGGLEPAG